MYCNNESFFKVALAFSERSIIRLFFFLFIVYQFNQEEMTHVHELKSNIKTKSDNFVTKLNRMNSIPI